MEPRCSSVVVVDVEVDIKVGGDFDRHSASFLAKDRSEMRVGSVSARVGNGIGTGVRAREENRVSAFRGSQAGDLHPSKHFFVVVVVVVVVAGFFSVIIITSDTELS